MKFEIDLSPALVRGLERMREAKGCSSIDEIIEMQLAWIKAYEPINEDEYLKVEEWARREGLDPTGIKRRARDGNIPYRIDERGRFWIPKALTRAEMKDHRYREYKTKRESE